LLSNSPAAHQSRKPAVVCHDSACSRLVFETKNGIKKYPNA
jgi:hypothetical protein